MSLEIALQNAISGLQTSKQSLQVISNNIANVNTEGYTRKILEQTSRVIEGQGYGVEISRISRNVDTGVLRQLRNETGNVARLSIKEDFLNQLNSIFGRPEDNDSVVHQISELGAQFDSLAVSPQIVANQFLTVKAATDVSNNLKKMSDEIQRLRSDANLKLESQIDEFNTKMDLVASINSDIVAFSASKISTAELEDQRDQALSRMSEMMDIKYFAKSDGSMTVFTAGGQTLIDGQPLHLSYNRPSSLSPTLEYTPTNATNYIIPGKTGYPVGGIPGIFVGEKISSHDITTAINSGSLKGLLEMRDGELPALQSQFDELAEKLKDAINAAHNTGTGYPPVATMTGDRYVASTTDLNASGILRIGVVDQSGALQNDQVFDLSTYATIGDLVTAIDGMANLSATISSTGRLVLSGENNNRVTVNELTSSISAAGDLEKGFSNFFGLNNFYSSSETFARYRSDSSSSKTSSAVTTGGTLQFTASGIDEDIVYASGDSLTALKDAINANANLQAAGITAQVISDGDGFRLQIDDSSGDNFAMVETGSGSVLDDTRLRTDYRGLSNRLSVRSDIQSNSFFISRGALQSNGFESSASNSIADPALAINTAGYGPSTGGTLTFTIDSSTTATINYAATDSLNDVATAINSNGALNSANITASVVVSGGVYSLKIVDNDSDNFWIDDSQPTTGLNVDTDQGVAVGDGSVAASIAEAFNTSVTFLSAPAAGGGLSQTDGTFTDYASSILAFNSAQANAVERERTFQQNLRDELFSKNSSVSGVNMDEELSNLIIYEQAYLAASRMISVTNELFKNLTDMVG